MQSTGRARGLSFGIPNQQVSSLATLVVSLFGFFMAGAPGAEAAVPLASSPSSHPVGRSPETVKVRLQRLKNSISITGMNLRFPGSAAPGISPFRALKVKWKTSANGLHLWVVEDRDSGVVISKFRARTLELAGFNVRVNLKPAPERLSFVPPAKGTGVDLIAQMDLEEYVRGVLPSEMPANWPLEALKAQAVAARTYALYRRNIRERAKAPYHLESTVMDQVFLTPLEQDRMSPRRVNVERAIRETKGIVLRDPMKRPFATFFHADCGGQTEAAHKIWGGDESLGTAVDDACPMNPMARWSARLSVSEVSERLRAVTGMAHWLAVYDIEETERSESGRIDKLRVKWSDGQESHLSGHQFRMAVGFDKVRSTNFRISKTNEVYDLSGKGYGHGVGMCQWGARHLAMSGKGFKDILRHYYPKAGLAGGSAPSEPEVASVGFRSSRKL